MQKQLGSSPLDCNSPACLQKRFATPATDFFPAHHKLFPHYLKEVVKVVKPLLIWSLVKIKYVHLCDSSTMRKVFIWQSTQMNYPCLQKSRRTSISSAQNMGLEHLRKSLQVCRFQTRPIAALFDIWPGALACAYRLKTRRQSVQWRRLGIGVSCLRHNKNEHWTVGASWSNFTPAMA